MRRLNSATKRPLNGLALELVDAVFLGEMARMFTVWLAVVLQRESTPAVPVPRLPV